MSKVKGRIENLGDLREVVGGIRSISAVRSQQAQRSLLGARRHAEIVEDALRATIRLLPEPVPAAPGEPEPERIVVLFTSEHGFVGAFNELLAEALTDRLAERPARLFVVGSRGAQILGERGVTAEWTTPHTTRPEGILALGRRIAAELYARAPEARAEVEVGFMRSERAARHTMQWLRVLPLDLSGFTEDSQQLPPLRNVPAPALVEQLVGEYVLTELVRSATESFASEHGARLVAMTMAHESMGDKLTELERLAAHLRQEEITTELLDVVTGAEALRDEHQLS